MRYFIQYPAGTSELVADAMSHFVDDFRAEYQDDSAMLFSSSSPMERVADIPFAKNAFAVISEIRRGDINANVAQLAGSLKKSQFPPLPGPRARGFRVMVHIDGELASVAGAPKREIERTVSACTGMRLEPSGRGQEYWVIGRLDMRDLMFCARLPKPARPKKARGALSHELSSMLVLASEPRPEDTFLDPFAGSGSFVVARLSLPAREVVYSDLDLADHRELLPGEVLRDRRLRLLDEDAMDLPSVPDGSVDAVVTDPPWGEHEELPVPYEEFARTTALSLARVLNPAKGRYVLLCARRGAPAFEAALTEAGLAVRQTHEILVNGHPATVFVGDRRTGTEPSQQTEEPQQSRRAQESPESPEAQEPGKAPDRQSDERRQTPRTPAKPLLIGMGTYRRSLNRFSR
ncbi:TRM11 family SAM-dependent methyltransferase [Streptomyces sp. NPDC048567]|uniref:TRM11 family SAM-dependent methyltransferase n=1 Tax=Streptomyces sp. NPDC048567 TaxID=3365570 RepID=UPI00371F3B55